VEDSGMMLSAALLSYEESFAAPAEFAYEGRYSPVENTAGGSVTEEEALQLAAKAVEVEPRELREEYSYEGPDGRRCYSALGRLLGVSRKGLEFIGSSRLVSTAAIGMDEAQLRAERFLARMDYTDLALYSIGRRDNVAVFQYAPIQDGVMRPDDALSISIALDDGSVYALDATKYSPRAVELDWETDEEQALSTLPEGVTAVSTRRLILKSPGGSYLPCWEVNILSDEGDEGARVYVDARTGRQFRVELGAAQTE